LSAFCAINLLVGIRVLAMRTASTNIGFELVVFKVSNALLYLLETESRLCVAWEKVHNEKRDWSTFVLHQARRVCCFHE
jgi:hypothetical protein